MKKRPSREHEREWKERLAGIRRSKDVLAGTLSAAHLPCNKGNCKCTRGELHGPTWRLSYREAGKASTVYVRQDDLEDVKAAVERYAALRQALQHAGRRNLRALLRRAKRRRRKRVERHTEEGGAVGKPNRATATGPSRSTFP